eukprot:g14805.t1
MYAAVNGHALLAEALVKQGANVSILSKIGARSALHYACAAGHIGVSEVLLKAGADVEATCFGGVCGTPLHLAIGKGHWELMRVLVKAGANVDNPGSDPEYRHTPLFLAAYHGQVDGVRELLRAEANPLLGWADEEAGKTRLPLDMAAMLGHLEVVRALVQEVGIEGCGGASGGVDALGLAAEKDHLDVMVVLTDAGVVDTGDALVQAAGWGSEVMVKYLLRQQQQMQQQETGRGERTGMDAYVSATDDMGLTPILSSILHCRSHAARVVRLLVDAGADTTSPVHVVGDREIHDTPLNHLETAIATLSARSKAAGGNDAIQQMLSTLKAIRRLLLQVGAVHAVSWLWQSGAPLITHDASAGTSSTNTPSAPLTLMMPILRRRAASRGVLLAALQRHSSKP